MRKKWWLLIGIVLNMILLLTSCKTHVHTFSNTWEYDEQLHWQSATCEHPDEKIMEASHVYNEWVEVSEATEEQTGLKKHSCIVCGFEESVVLPKLSHDYGAWQVVKSPTKEETGMLVQICSRSDADIHAVILPVLSEEDYTISPTKLPSCLEEGIDEYTYYQDGQEFTFEVKVDALGHDLIHSKGKNPTCFDEGYQEYDYCSRCDYTTYEEIHSLGHNFGFWKVIKEPTFTEGGSLLRYCGRDASHTEKLNLPALSETAYTLEHTKIATCIEDGIDTYSYHRDGQSFQFKQTIPSLGHDLVHHEALDASCEEVGNKAYESCSRCDYTTYEKVEALGHQYGDWVISVDPTEVSVGLALKICANDQKHQLEVVLPQLNETDYRIEHQKEATYLEDGLDTYIYEKNGASFEIEVVLPALGHDFGPWELISAAEASPNRTLQRVCKRDPNHIEIMKVQVDEIKLSILPTCEEKGLDIYTCLVGGEPSTFEVVVPSLGHDMIHHEAKLPTCEVAGCNAYDTCSRCDYKTELIEVEPLGHLYGNWFVEEAPTSTVEGTCVKKCQHDPTHRIYDQLPILNLENYTLTHASIPNCVEAGLDDYSYEIDQEVLHIEVVLPALGHDLVYHGAVAPTCTATGNDSYEACKRCNYTTYHAIKALGHSYGVWEITTEPTLKQTGIIMKTCARDASHNVYEYLPALSEGQYQKTTLLEPQCLEAGVDTYVYIKDRQVFTFAVVVEALDHHYGSWTVAVKPTFTSSGQLTRVCSRNASHTEVFDLPALNNFQYALNHTVPAKCLETGIDVYTYYKDYQEFSFEVASSPLGHKLVHHEESEPTCEEEGGTAYEACSRCDYKTEHGVVPALGHTYDINGYCARCSKIYYKTSPLSATECKILAYDGSKDNTEIFIPEQIDGLKVVAVEPGIYSGLTSITKLDLAFVGSTIDSGYLGELFGATSYLNQNEVIPATLTEVTVGGTRLSEGAFYGCSNLTKITIDSTVQYIGIAIVAGCTSLEQLSVPFIGRSDSDDTYTYLGYFYGVTNYILQEEAVNAKLQRVSVTDATTIGVYAFYQCYQLKEIILTDDITLIDTMAFFGCSGLTQLLLPKKLMVIKDSAFEESGLTSIVIPDSVVSVASCLFKNCTQLEEVVFGKRSTKILGYQFHNCVNLRKVTLTENIVSIADYSFSGCSSLEALIIPSSVNLMGVSVFSDCNQLTLYCVSAEQPTQWDANFNPLNRPVYWGYRENSIVNLDGYEYIIQKDVAVMTGYSGQSTAITVPATIEVNAQSYPVQIGAYAFQNSLLTSITLAEGVTEMGTYAFKDSLALTEVTIPSTITSIPNNCFRGCTMLSTVNLIAGLQTIEEEAFYCCNSLQNITLPEGLTTIGARAFYQCSSLVDIQLPNSLTTIGSAIFSGATSLKNVVFGTGLTRISNFMFEYCQSLTVMNLPNTITEIGTSAFIGCGSLESIYLPDTITTMGFNVFHDCDKVIIFSKYQEVPAGGWNAEWNRYNRPVYFGKTLNDVFDYGDFDCILYQDAVVLVKYHGSNSVQGVFGYVPVNDVKYPIWIGDYCFAGSAVERVSLSEGVKRIGDYAFSKCKNLSVIDFSSDLTSIGESAFYNTKLREVTLPSGIQELSWRVFGSCTSLTTVSLNTGLEIIGEDAFEGCTSLASISIPATVTTIGEDAFTSCSKLKTVDIPSSVTTIGYNAFAACASLFIFCEAPAAQQNWDEHWNSSYRPVYYGTSTNAIESINDFKFIISNEVNSLQAILVYYDGTATEVEIPSQVTINGVNYNVRAGNFSFAKTGVTKVIVQEGVQSLGVHTFYQCESLVEIQIPSTVTALKSRTFAYCSSLTTVELPSTLVSISNLVFYRCFALKELNLPEGLKTIGEEAFYSSGLVSAVLPNSLTSLGKRAFASCRELRSVTLSTGLDTIAQGTFSYCEKLESVTIPENIEKIDSSAFSSCESLTSIIIPSGVLSISSYAFSYCTLLTIFCEISEKPAAWHLLWNSSKRPVYWYQEEAPTTAGNYWHYVDMEIEIWPMMV